MSLVLSGLPRLEAMLSDLRAGAAMQRCLLRVSGDAMEPTLRPGDLVLIEPVSRLIQGAVYVLMVGGVVMVRRLKEIGPDRYVFGCDNERYQDLTVTAADAAEYRVLGRVVLVEQFI